MFNQFFKIIHTRRSIRKFSQRKVSRKTIRKLLNVVRYAPSSLNGQPWEVIIVRKKEIKERLAQFKNNWCPPEKKAFRADFIKEAPIVLILCVDRKKSYGRWIENGVITTTYLMLAATALGLGSTFMTTFTLSRPEQMQECRKILRIPSTINPVAILPIGYPAKKPMKKRLRLLRTLIHYEHF